MKRITEKVMTNRAQLALGLAGAWFLAAAPALAAPKAAAKRPAKVAVKAAAKPAAKPAQKAPDKGLLIETDCFTMSIPSNMVPIQRIKSAARPYRGVWGFVTAPNANLKVWVRCLAHKAGNFKKVFQRSIEKMSGWIANFKVQDVSFEKDEKGRDMGSVVGVGYLKAIDRKTKKSIARRHFIHRIERPTPDRNLTVNITVAAGDHYQGKLEPIVELLLKDFEVVDLAAKRKIKARSQAIKAKMKAKSKL